MSLTLRLGTVFCYFLPFTFFLATCNNLVDLRVSYNQKEADSNLLLQQHSVSSEYDSTLINNDTVLNIQMQTAEQEISSDTIRVASKDTDTVENANDRIIRKLFFPSNTSLSGVGSIFYYKNLMGKILIGTGLFISVILLSAFKFLQSPKTKLYLLSTNLLCLLTFIIDSYISKVTLLYGTWVLLVLLLLQLIIEINDKKKAYR